MLHHILKYAEKRGHVSEPGFIKKDIRWLIACDESGRNPQVIEYNSNDLCPDAGTKAQSKAGAHFLVDKLSTVCRYQGAERNGSPKPLIEKDEAKKFKTFVSMLKEAGEKDVSGCLQVHALLNNDAAIIEITRQLASEKAKPSDKISFRVGKKNLLSNHDWQKWWRVKVAQNIPTNKMMRCLISGDLIAPAEKHEVKVQGLKIFGGRGQESVICFDKGAFKSYKLKSALNSATSVEIASAYANELNQLIRENGVKVGNAIAVYWFVEQLKSEEDDFLAWLTEPPDNQTADAERQARELLNAVREGRRPDLANNSYCALLLSGASGRVMVRDFIQGSFEELLAHVYQWFSDLSIYSLNNSIAKRPKLVHMLTSPLAPRGRQQKYEDWLKPVTHMAQPFWESATKGRPIPEASVYRLVPMLGTFFIQIADILKSENRQSPEYPQLISLLYHRMALIKAYHIRKGDENMKPYLNREHPSPAYHCGCLLAVLASLQKAALGDVGSGVVQRYYTATSQTPGLYIGRLVSNAQNHLAKLDVKLAWWFNQSIAEIMGEIGDVIPATLSLEEQSLFALGYYQQLAQPKKSDDDTTTSTEEVQP